MFLTVSFSTTLVNEPLSVVRLEQYGLFPPILVYPVSSYLFRFQKAAIGISYF